MGKRKIPPSRLRLKRVYEPAAADDGLRILVDRLWPRGIRKDDAALNDWMKDIAPSPELRQWFGHDPARWDGFRQRYAAELKGKATELERLRALAAKKTVTLLYGAHSEDCNHAIVLRDVLLAANR